MLPAVLMIVLLSIIIIIETIFLRITVRSGKELMFYADRNKEPSSRSMDIDMELFKSKQRYQTLTEMSPVGIFHTDAEGFTTYVNPCWCEISGLTLKEALGDGWLRAIHEEDRNTLSKGWTEATSIQQISVAEYRFVRPDGSIRWVIGQAMPEKDPDGRIIGYVGTTTDITERKKAEEDLIFNEQQLNLIYASISDPIFLLSREEGEGGNRFRFISVNRAFLKSTGLREEQVLNKYVSEVVQQPSLDMVLGKYREAISNKSIVQWEEVSPYPAGIKTGIVSITPIFDKYGNCNRLVGAVHDITERKKSEEEIEKREKRFRSTLDMMLEGVQIYDFDWRCLYANDAVAMQGPYSKEQILGVPLMDNYPGIEETELFRIFKQCRDEKTSTHIEYEFAFPDGSKKWFELSIQPNAEGLFLLSVDRTERHRSAEKLKRSNEQLRLSQQIAHVGYWEMDLRGQLHYWSDEMYRLFGVENDGTIIGFDEFMDGVSPEDRQMLQESHRALIESGQSMQVEFRYVNEDGLIRHFITKADAIVDGSGEAIRLTGTTQDITERKKIDNEILKERNLLDSIINSLPGSFYLFTREGKFLRWNRNFEKVTLYGPSEIRQMQPLDFFEKGEKEYVRMRIEKVFLTGAADAEANFYTKDKKMIPFYFTGIAIEYNGESCLLGVGIDISEKVEAQEKIRQTTEQLRQLTAHLEEIREEERASIAREVHDELGQQLTGLKMDIYWLKDELKSPDEGINLQIESILGLVDGTINIVRRIAASLRPLLLDDLGLVDAMRWHGSEFQKKFGIRVGFDTDLANLVIHPKIAIGLFRIFQESLTNVARHSEATKVLSVLKREGDMLLLSIADNGKGFDVSKIAGKRTLGILGMKERVLMMDGKYEINSRESAGTRIEVGVPIG